MALSRGIRKISILKKVSKNMVECASTVRDPD
jgi:hypothetical protein